MTKDYLDIDWNSFDPAGAHNDGLSISSAATLTIPSGAKKLMIQALTQNVRITFDGTAPTTTCGFQLVKSAAPQIFPIGPHTVVKVIEEAGTADLQYQFGY